MCVIPEYDHMMAEMNVRGTYDSVDIAVSTFVEES
jgi:hypothetical protein